MTIEMKNAAMESPSGLLFHNVSFCVCGGEIACVSGESQRTNMLMQALAGLQPLKEGFVSIDGEPMQNFALPYFRRSIAYVPSADNLPEESAQDVVRELSAMRANKFRSFPQDTLLEEMAKLNVGKEQLKRGIASDRAVGQRAAIAIARLMKRPIMLLVSPTSKQSHEGAELIAEYIVRQKQSCTAIVVSTNDAALLSICDKSIEI